MCSLASILNVILQFVTLYLSVLTDLQKNHLVAHLNVDISSQPIRQHPADDLFEALKASTYGISSAELFWTFPFDLSLNFPAMLGNLLTCPYHLLVFSLGILRVIFTDVFPKCLV